MRPLLILLPTVSVSSVSGRRWGDRLIIKGLQTLLVWFAGVSGGGGERDKASIVVSIKKTKIAERPRKKKKLHNIDARDTRDTQGDTQTHKPTDTKSHNATRPFALRCRQYARGQHTQDLKHVVLCKRTNARSLNPAPHQHVLFSFGHLHATSISTNPFRPLIPTHTRPPSFSILFTLFLRTCDAYTEQSMTTSFI